MILTEDNFMVYGAKFYDNPNCITEEEFIEDISRIRHIKKLFRKYRDTGELKERLILNHLTVLYNVFFHEACTNMLILKLNEYLDILKPFLVFLKFWPERIVQENVITMTSNIRMDDYIIGHLREIQQHV